MTRFQMEITGQLGDWWKANAEKEVERAVAKATEDATVDEAGVIRWNTNGRCIPDDFCEKLEYAGFKFSREATREAREIDDNEFIKRYKAMKHEPTAEEMNEMRAAFGPGTTVVDLLSGREIRL